MIRWLETGGLKIGQFAALSQLPGVVHGFSTRIVEPYDSLNLGPNTDDDPAAVAENRRRFFFALDLVEDQMAMPVQVHGDHIAVVDKPGIYPDTDGLVTNTPGIALTVKVADCVPVFVVDPVRQAVGLFHAGWRGTAAGIVAKGVALMVDQFGSRPEDLRTGIGPGIGPCCFEVGEEVLPHFPASCQNGQHVDLWVANQQQLVASGVRFDYIESVSMCTSCWQPFFFSHRRDQGVTGRMMAVLSLGFTSATESNSPRKKEKHHA